MQQGSQYYWGFYRCMVAYSTNPDPQSTGHITPMKDARRVLEHALLLFILFFKDIDEPRGAEQAQGQSKDLNSLCF